GQVAIAYGISADAVDRSGEGVGNSPGERSGLGILEGLSPTLKAQRPNAVAAGWAVRRLTPPECARLQGFPDDHSRIPWRGKPAEICPDGPQYKTYGNSMATKKMRWLARRLADAIADRPAA
ncbi:MAG: DNA cytosine methyltransferase, partial [Beijerinckiaceae bacterium]|nr:DNA cytosine methyltransferase [Beijerinckiaceae bacterium]